MKELLEKLKERLRTNKDNYVVYNDWAFGDTETGYCGTEEFDIDKLMAEIDEFAASFEGKKGGNP